MQLLFGCEHHETEVGKKDAGKFCDKFEVFIFELLEGIFICI
jgi:hypothetical protein